MIFTVLVLLSECSNQKESQRLYDTNKTEYCNHEYRNSSYQYKNECIEYFERNKPPEVSI